MESILIRNESCGSWWFFFASSSTASSLFFSYIHKDEPDHLVRGLINGGGRFCIPRIYQFLQANSILASTFKPNNAIGNPQIESRK
jgi:hypothetical protein